MLAFERHTTAFGRKALERIKAVGPVVASHSLDNLSERAARVDAELIYVALPLIAL